MDEGAHIGPTCTATEHIVFFVLYQSIDDGALVGDVRITSGRFYR